MHVESEKCTWKLERVHVRGRKRECTSINFLKIYGVEPRGLPLKMNPGRTVSRDLNSPVKHI